MKKRGAISISFSAALWGLFWIPLRYFDESGISALWAVAALNFAASVVAIPVAFFLGEFERRHLKWFLIGGLGMGAANVLYFAGIILSDVVRVIFLFYLLPLWATLFARVLYGVPIGRNRMVALGLAVVGIWLLLGAGGWPIPENIGDVFGILAGMFWAFGLTLMRGTTGLGAFATSAWGLFFAFVMAVGLGFSLQILLPDVQPAAPELDTVIRLAPAIAAFAILIVWPTLVGQLWGAKYLAATTAALLTMSEILAATISTALLDASDLTLVSWLGAGLILIAILADILNGNPEDA